VFDASGAWGRSETLLGDLMPRPLPFRLVIATVRPDKGADFVEQELRASLARLAVERVDAVVVPLAGDLFSPNGAAMWTRLRQLRDSGLIGKIGVSLHSTDDPVGSCAASSPT